MSPLSPEKSDTAKCEHCGKSESKTKLKKKPYCSTTCARAAKVSATNATTNGAATPPADVNGDEKKINVEAITIEQPAASPTSSTATTPSSSSAGKRPSSQTNGTGASEPKKPALELNGDDDEQESFLVKWTVKDVYDYMFKSSGYGEYAVDFESHEIDGQALLLLNENHLVQTMNIKLGPALKIMKKIEEIKNSAAPVEQ